MSRARALLLSSILALGATGAGAYVWQEFLGTPITWTSDQCVFSLHPVSFGAGSEWDLTAQYAMSNWNALYGAGSNFRFFYNRDACDPGNHFDGCNSVAFLDAAEFDPGVLAVSYGIWSPIGPTYTDSDVWFNVGWSWTTGGPGFNGGSPYSFEGVAAHEFGHTLGFRPHEDRFGATMNSYYPNGGFYGRGDDGYVIPRADDRSGARFLYAAGGGEVDLAGLSWTMRTSGDGYVVTTNASGSGTTGGTVDLEWSLDNLGNQDANGFRIGFYLSTNDFISTGDRFLGSLTGNWPAGAFGTFTTTLGIPADAAPGTYWLGMIADDTALFAENREWNNWSVAPHSTSISDVTAPPAPIGLSATPALWSSVNSFSLDWTNPADASGISGAYWKRSAAPAFPTDGTFGAAKPLTVTASAAGATTVYVWLRDGSGNVSHANRASTTIRWDPTAPTGTVTANAGDAFTSLSTVTLSLTASDAHSGMGAGASMRFSNDGATWSPWEPYAATRAGFSLTAFGGSSAEGAKTVRAQVRDAAGNPSATLTDAITYTTAIRLLAPPNGSALAAAPTFRWTHGTSSHYTIEFSLNGFSTVRFGTYANKGIVITSPSFTLPAAFWNKVPSGRTISWRVKGADSAGGLASPDQASTDTFGFTRP